MRSLRSEAGFSAFEVMLVILVLAVVAVGGYRVIQGHQTATTASNSSLTVTPSIKAGATAVSTAPAVTNATDLNAAQQTLDQNDPTSANSTDSSALNADLSGLN